jgi:outer membrane protein TolC
VDTGGRGALSQFALLGTGIGVVWVLLGSTAAHAQPPTPAERVTFSQAIERAIARNPSSAIAAAGILRADALLAQARSGARPQINANATSTTINRGVEFEGVTVTPRTSVTAGLDLRMPVYAPAAWARRVEAQDNVGVATLSAAETRRQTALATADAYLAIIARRRIVEANVRAADTAKAHADLAAELETRGTGSRLNRLRAEQELATDQGLIESARFLLYRAQEALGVLLVADGPVDAADEPAFDLPPTAQQGSAPAAAAPTADAAARPALGNRTDVRLFAAQEQAAERVLRNNRTSYLPVFEGIFQPQSTHPSQFFVPANSWRVLLQVNVPLFDSGFRAGEARARESALDAARASRARAVTAVASEVRTGREAVASSERELASRRAAASRAQDVVNIVNISFRAGAATNIEVIDAERRARDADTDVAVSEDGLRRARLELLNALGLFP